MAADIDLFEEVYAFVRARLTERIDQSVKRHHPQDKIRWDREALKAVQWYYAEAKRWPTNEAIAAAIDVFRKRAMPFSDHPDYDPLWTLPDR